MSSSETLEEKRHALKRILNCILQFYRDLLVVKIRNVVPGTKENCHRALDAKMHSQGSDYMCASKDRDGLRPFGLVRVERTGDSPLVGGVFGSFEECLASL